MASNSDTSANLDTLMVDEPPVGRIRGAVRTIMIVFVIAALVLNINKIQLINFVLDNFTPAAFFTWYTQNIYEPTLIIDTSYYYVIIGLLQYQKINGYYLRTSIHVQNGYCTTFAKIHVYAVQNGYYLRIHTRMLSRTNTTCA